MTLSVSGIGFRGDPDH